MGIGTGALIAGVVRYERKPHSLPSSAYAASDGLPLAYEPHGRSSIRLCGDVNCIHALCISRCICWASKVRFPLVTLTDVPPLKRSLASRLAKIQRVGLSSSNNRKGVGGLSTFCARHTSRTPALTSPFTLYTVINLDIITCCMTRHLYITRHGIYN